MAVYGPTDVYGPSSQYGAAPPIVVGKTPFDNLQGLFQGRIEPQLAPAADGSFVWSMGIDLATRSEIIKHGDFIRIEQVIDVTDITYLKAQIRVRQPTNLDKRDVTTGLEIVGLGSSTISAVVVATSAAVECANSSTYDLLEALTLTVRVDGGATQTVAFTTGDFADITNATAIEVAAVLDAALTGASVAATSGNTKVTITSDNRGANSSIEITGGTGNTGGTNRMGFSTTLVAGVDVKVTTTEKHYLVTGETVVVNDALGAPIVGTINIKGTHVITVIDDNNFTLDNVTASGTYVSGGSIGKGERLYLPAGWTVDEYQRVIDVTGSTFSDNNGEYRILGFQEQPGVNPPQLAWVERPGVPVLTPDDIATSASLAGSARGGRWKVSLLVDSGGGFKERARTVQKTTQSGFFRTDLGGYVRRLTGEHSFGVQLTLVEHETTNVYALPPQP